MKTYNLANPLEHAQAIAAWQPINDAFRSGPIYAATFLAFGKTGARQQIELRIAELQQQLAAARDAEHAAWDASRQVRADNPEAAAIERAHLEFIDLFDAHRA